MPVDTNMLAYFLGAAGQGIAGGNVAEGLAPAVMNMAGKKMTETDNKKKMEAFRKLFAGDYGSTIQHAVANGGKVSVDGEGTTIKVPTSLLGNKESLGSPSKPGGLPDFTNILTGFDAETPTAPTKSATMSPDQSPVAGDTMSQLLSFFSPGPQVDLSNADLTGLTPEDVSNALNLRAMESNRGLDTLAKIMNIKQSVASIQNMEDDNKRAWENMSKVEQTEMKKNFDLLNQDLVSSGKKPMSFRDYFLMNTNDSFKDYYISRNDPAYEAFMLRQKKAGASTTSVSVGQKAFETDMAHQEANILDPTYPAAIEKDVREKNASTEKTIGRMRKTRAERDAERKMTPGQKKQRIEQDIRSQTVRRISSAFHLKYGEKNVRSIFSGGKQRWYVNTGKVEFNPATGKNEPVYDLRQEY